MRKTALILAAVAVTFATEGPAIDEDIVVRRVAAVTTALSRRLGA